MCEEYNGWTNRETWATALWINNDEGLYNQAQDYATTALQEHRQDNEGEGGANCSALNCLADTFEGWIEELLDEDWESIKSMRRDIGSLYRVNWREIAESFTSEIKVQELSA